MALGAVPALAQTAATEDPEGVSVEQQADSEGEKDVEPRAVEENSLDVVYVSNQGSDTDGDGSEGHPLASLAEAVSAVKDGGTVYVMSDLSIAKMAYVNGKSVTIDGGEHVVTRADEFEKSQDLNRGGFNGSMFEVANGATLRLESITLDDAMLHGGSEFVEEKTGQDVSDKNNEAKVQSGIITAFGDGHGHVILGEGTILKNYGGLCAVRVGGNRDADGNWSGSTLLMESGSMICDNSSSVAREGGFAAIWNQGGKVEMQEGSSIEHVNGRAIYSEDGGITTVGGSISDIKSNETMMAYTGSFSGDFGGMVYYGEASTGTFELTSTGSISDISSHDGKAGDVAVMLIGSSFTMDQGSSITDIGTIGLFNLNGGKVYINGRIEDCHTANVFFRLWGGGDVVFYLGETGVIKNCSTSDAAMLYRNGGRTTIEVNGEINNFEVGTVLWLSNNNSMKNGSMTLGSTGKIAMCSGKAIRIDDPSTAVISGEISDCDGYAIQYGYTAGSSLEITEGSVVSGNNNGATQIYVTANNNPAAATDALQHVAIGRGALVGNQSVTLPFGTVALDANYSNIGLGVAHDAAVTAIKNAVAAEHSDWVAVGSKALWLKPSEESVHFMLERPSSAKNTTMCVAYIAVGTDGLPADGAQLTLVAVENTDPVDVTLEGLTPGQSYVMMLVNTNIYQLAPDDVTIYTGGGQGQETSDNGFPTPTFTDSLDDIKTLEIDGNKVESDDLMGELLKLFTVTYTDAEGNPVTNDAEAGEYTMTLQWADGEHEVSINGNDVDDEFGTGTLTVRYVENIDEAIDGTNTYELLADEPTELVEHAEAVAKESPILPDLLKTEFYTNDDKDRQVAADGIQLLDDDLLVDEDGTDRQYLLEQRAVDEGVLPALGEGQAYRFDFHYLDLVDAYNGNAWVSASYGTTVYLPYPDEMTYDEAQGIDFTVVHYPELHREYGFSGEAEVVPAIESCVPEVIEAECTPQGIKFNVPREGFSPYAIVWQTDVRTITATADEGSTVTPAGTFTVSVEEGKTFSIEAKENYAIADVTLNGVSVLDQVKDGTFTVPASEEDQELVVTSRSTLHTITATAGEGGTITPSGDVTVSEGDGQTFTITPNDGYVIADVKVDGESVGRVDSYAFDGVTEDHSIEATFETESAAPHEHVWSDWKCDGETHWKVCEVCGAVSERAEHTFGDWEQVSEATESEKGQWVRACTVCGYEQHGTTPVTEPDGSGMPGTGDRTPTVLTGVLAACGAALVAGTVIYRRRHDG